MVVELKEYDSAAEIAESIEEKISGTKSQLGDYLRRLDDIRSLAERSKKIRKVLLKLAGKKGENKSLGELTVGDLSIVLDANPFHELTAIEEVVRSQQDRLAVLQEAKDAMEWVDEIGETEGLRYLVVERDGVPEKILFKIS
jgi:hypothetical protein